MENYKMQELIKDRMEYIADMKGKSVTSITKLTGLSDETKYYEVIKTSLTAKTIKSLEKFSDKDFIVTYAILGDIVEELEA